MSLKDNRALHIMNQTVKKIGDQHSVGLLWKDDDLQLPNNREMAVKRLLMKRKFITDPNLHQKYFQKIDDHIKNGYATAFSDNVVPSGVNYIP